MGSRDTSQSEVELAELIGSCYGDPLRHVMLSYDWVNDRSIQMVKLPKKWREQYPTCEYGPDQWACEYLEELGQEIRLRGFNGRDAVAPLRTTGSSGHGIGKSVMAAWLTHLVMDTRPFSKGTVTANTDTQLRTKTWAGIASWFHKKLTAHWYDLTTGRGSMAIRHKKFPNDWYCTAQTSREENSESFAGQHAANSTSWYLFDEASGICDKIYEVREGGLTDGEPMVFDWGNPTRNSGEFYENTFGKKRHRFAIKKIIDSRTVAITNKKMIQEMIDDYGIDSDRVKVRVLGQAPAAGSCQFIGTDIVHAAMRRDLSVESNAPLVMGVDVARFGDDDSVIFVRQGSDARSWQPICVNGADTHQLTGLIVKQVKYFRDVLGKRFGGIFVDGTGGYGGGVVDNLRALSYPVHEIHFGSKPIDGNSYRYKADEMWGTMRDHIKTRLCLPYPKAYKAEELEAELTAREFAYMLGTNKIHLEAKKEMKERGVRSPDIADALALTYAMEVNPEGISDFWGEAGNVQSEFDPYA